MPRREPFTTCGVSQGEAAKHVGTHIALAYAAVYE